jgi:hypothetical protein
MREALLFIPLLISVAWSAWFKYVLPSPSPNRHKPFTNSQNSDILKALFQSDKPTVTRFVGAVPRAFLDELEHDEQQAGQFICEILNGNVPGAFENLAEDLATDVLDDIKDGFDDITSFVKSLPTLAPEILENIISDGEDVVSVIEELFTDPGGVVTLIEGDVKTVISDIESVATSLWHGFTCLFKPKKDCGTSTADPAATLSSSCGVVMAAATTTWSPAPSSTTYAPAQPTAAVTSSMAVETSTAMQALQSSTQEVEPAVTTSSAAAETSTTEQASQSSTQNVEPTATTSSAAAQATTEQGSTQTSSPSSAGAGGGGVPSDGGLGFVLHTWVVVLVCLIGLIIVL